MMDLDLFRRWINRLGYLIQLVLELERQLDELSVRRHIAIASSGKREEPNVLKIDAQFVRTERQFAVAVQTLKQWSERETLQEIHELVLDVQARIDNAVDLQEDYRRMLAMLELWRTLAPGTVTEGMSLEEAEHRAALLATEIEVQIALARRQLPLNTEIVLA